MGMQLRVHDAATLMKPALEPGRQPLMSKLQWPGWAPR